MDDYSSAHFGSEMERLRAVMAKLRNPDGGCPWDLEQTFATIAPYTIEEAYEVADAVENKDWDNLRDELGDLLLQVVFHSQMAQELGLFSFDDVARSINEKMLKRHPHVFGQETVNTADDQTVAWEAQKAEERKQKALAAGQDHPSALDGVIAGLPALTRAMKLQNRAERVGFDWDSAPHLAEKVREELEEVLEEVPGNDPDRLHEEIGDLLFTCIGLARKVRVDADASLRSCLLKFETRFRRMEELLRLEDGLDAETAAMPEMEKRWLQAKAEEKLK